LLMLSSTPSLVPVLRFCPRSFFSTIPAPTHIYTLSLHDALPISLMLSFASWRSIFVVTGALGLAWTLWWRRDYFPPEEHPRLGEDRKSTRLNSTHGSISYAVFCLKKKKKKKKDRME